MKCILGAVSIAILITATAQAGLVADDGAGITKTDEASNVSEQVSAREAQAPDTIVEEKGGPAVVMPKPAKQSSPEAPAATETPKTKSPAEAPKVAAPAKARKGVKKTSVADENAQAKKAVEKPKAKAKRAKRKANAKAAKKSTPEPKVKQAETAKPKAPAKLAKQARAKKPSKPAADPTTPIVEQDATTAGQDMPRTRGKRAIFIAAGPSDGGSSVRAAAFGMDLFCADSWVESKNWQLTSYLEILGAYWEGDPGHTGITDIHEGGVSGYLRWIYKKREGSFIHPYIDVGLGVHYINEES
ncbi:MAG: hypothetical protein HN341_05545, partial [Verrucomicrobia bacterium]|nr:hypothetical protein [Verrucomicrobiota bacterium]